MAGIWSPRVGTVTRSHSLGFLSGVWISGIWEVGWRGREGTLGERLVGDCAGLGRGERVGRRLDYALQECCETMCFGQRASCLGIHFPFNADSMTDSA